jgi:hypothetical protein
MLHSIDQARCASLPLTALPALAALRCAFGVRVALTPQRAWLQWPESKEDVLPCVLPIQGARLYVQREAAWYPLGSYLPAADVPTQDKYGPLAACLSPAPFQAEPAQSLRFQSPALDLVADHRTRPTTAMLCELTTVKKWAESPTVSAFVLQSLRAALHESLVLMMGQHLPLLPRCRRLWGKSVLVPIGNRLEPALPESLIRSALGVNEDEILLFAASQPEVVSMDALQPLSRIGVRRALMEQT